MRRKESSNVGTILQQSFHSKKDKWKVKSWLKMILYIYDPSTVRIEASKSRSHQMLTYGDIWADHWLDGSMYLLQIEPHHHYPCEQLRPNDIRIRSKDLLVRIISSGVESSFRNDVWHWYPIPNHPVNMMSNDGSALTETTKQLMLTFQRN